MTNLSEYTDEQLLMELISRNGYDDAASRVIRNGVYYESEIGIGEDYSASIVLSDEDYRALRDAMLVQS